MYTNGTERYASVIQQHLANLFHNNYIQAMFSRKTSHIREKKQLFKMLCKRSISIVVDDRVDVWCKADRPNVVQVTPYTYKGFLDNSTSDHNIDDTLEDAMVDDTDEDLLNLSDYLNSVHNRFFEHYHKKGIVTDVRLFLQDDKFKA